MLVAYIVLAVREKKSPASETEVIVKTESSIRKIGLFLQCHDYNLPDNIIAFLLIINVLSFYIIFHKSTGGIYVNDIITEIFDKFRIIINKLTSLFETSYHTMRYLKKVNTFLIYFFCYPLFSYYKHYIQYIKIQKRRQTKKTSAFRIFYFYRWFYNFRNNMETSSHSGISFR